VVQAHLEINSRLLWKELDVMNAHQTAMVASVERLTQDDAVTTVANRTQTAFETNTRSQPAVSEPSLAPPPAVARPHTLILTGALDRRSAHALEAEIERLCEEGVTGITLDLRELTYIDAIGVAVIAFRCRLCLRRGYEFSLIPGSRSINRVFEKAGVRDVLPFERDEAPAPRPALVLAYSSRKVARGGAVS
jgi:anti-anti-sigma factor